MDNPLVIALIGLLIIAIAVFVILYVVGVVPANGNPAPTPVGAAARSVGWWA